MPAWCLDERLPHKLDQVSSHCMNVLPFIKHYKFAKPGNSRRHFRNVREKGEMVWSGAWSPAWVFRGPCGFMRIHAQFQNEQKVCAVFTLRSFKSDQPHSSLPQSPCTTRKGAACQWGWGVSYVSGGGMSVGGGISLGG